MTNPDVLVMSNTGTATQRSRNSTIVTRVQGCVVVFTVALVFVVEVAVASNQPQFCWLR